MTYGYAVPACGVAVATPYFVVRYAVDQATEGVCKPTITAGETAIQAVLVERVHHPVLRDALFQWPPRTPTNPWCSFRARGLFPLARPPGTRI